MSQLIIALDFPNLNETKKFLSQAAEIDYVKVGMELFYSEGYQVLEYLKKENKKIFLDLKLHDIPQTVHNALKVLDQLDVDMVNVHALGGQEMLLAARAGFSGTLIGVSILTSMNHLDLHRVNIHGSVTNNVQNLISLCASAGLNGVVCSAADLNTVTRPGKNFVFVTPGIRKHAKSADQKRVVTPKEAMKLGADYLVVGREVTGASHPAKMYAEILKDIR